MSGLGSGSDLSLVRGRVWDRVRARVQGRGKDRVGLLTRDRRRLSVKKTEQKETNQLISLFLAL